LGILEIKNLEKKSLGRSEQILETKFLQSFARDGLGTVLGLARGGLENFRKRKVWGGQGVGENLETKISTKFWECLARDSLGRSWEFMEIKNSGKEKSGEVRELERIWKPNLNKV
jgi:hypothetical protein